MEKALEQFAKQIINTCMEKPKDVNYGYKGWMVGPSFRFEIDIIDYIDIHRDFISNFTDIITLGGVMKTRDYYQLIKSHSLNEDLECHVEKREMVENSVIYALGGTRTLTKYRIIFPNEPTNGLGGAGGTNFPRRPENVDQSLTQFVIQLVEKQSLEMKFAKWAGLLQETVPGQLAAMAISGGMEQYGVNNVHMVDPDVTTPRQIIIPQSTNTKDVPHYLQENYGIYNFGIGSYRLGEDWYIYPLFNTERWEKEVNRITISIVDQKFVPIEMPRTYFTNNGELVMYIFDDMKVENNQSSAQLNTGTGLQVINPQENRALNLNEVGTNKWQINGEKGMSTFNLIDRKDGLQNIVRIPENSINLAKHMSNILKNKGRYIELVWKYANYNLLLPGMPVKIMYIDDKRTTLYGVLHEFHAIAQRDGQTAIDPPYTCHARLRLYVGDPKTN